MCNNIYSKKLKYLTDRAEAISRLIGVTEFFRIGPLTVCKIESDDIIAMGLSICSEHDKFIKSIGRFWACRRALRAYMGRSLRNSSVSLGGLFILHSHGITFEKMVNAWIFRGDAKEDFYKFIENVNKMYKTNKLQ